MFLRHVKAAERSQNCPAPPSPFHCYPVNFECQVKENSLLFFYPNNILSLFFLILQPARVSSNFKSLTYIFFLMSLYQYVIIPSNLTAVILDHISQFLMTVNIFLNFSGPNFNKYEKDQKTLIKKSLFLIIFQLTEIIFACLNINILQYKIFIEKFESLTPMLH